MSKSIYPSIPSPGNDVASLQATVAAMRQTLTLLISNAQHPNSKYAPASAAQQFLTRGQVDQSGGVASTGSGGGGVVVSSTPGPKGDAGPPGPPGAPGPAGPAGAGTPSNVLPIMDGTATIGTSLAYAREGHIHPSDTAKYDTSNPAGYQTAAQVTASLGAYLPLAGGTLTGQLKISGTTALNRSMFGQTSGSNRWEMNLGNTAAESGGNAGSDFVLSAYNDAGSFLSTPLNIVRSTGTVYFNAGMAWVNAKAVNNDATFVLNKNGAAQASYIWSANNGVLRWSLDLGNATAETGTGNAGTDFSIRNFTDAGGLIGTPLTIKRSSGLMTLGNGLSFGSTVAPGGASDLSRHIALYSTTYGLSVTSGRLNIVTGGGTVIGNGTTDWVTVSSGGSITTSNYVDTSALNTITFQKSRGGSLAAATPVLGTDFIGQISAQGYTGSAFSTVGAIRFKMLEPTPSTTAMGGYVDIVAPPLGQTAIQVVAAFQYGQVSLVSVSAQATNQIFNIQKSASGFTNVIRGYTGSLGAAQLRWQIELGDATAEGGGNVGSNFAIKSYDSAGALLSTPIQIARATGAVQALGTATNDNAPAGYVGEVISSNVTTGVTLTTATATNVTSISLTAGDWDVRGEVWIAVGAGGATLVQGGINSVSATIPAASALNTSRTSQNATVTASSTEVYPLRAARISLSATTTIYLVASATFPSGTTTATGNIIARRMR